MTSRPYIHGTSPREQQRLHERSELQAGARMHGSPMGMGTAASGMDLFDKQWASYRLVVDHNLMQHREVAAASAGALRGWWETRPPAAMAPRLVDLGCGDLAGMAAVLRDLPLGSYTGIDLCAAVLPLAEQALGHVPYPTHWQEADLRDWAFSSNGAAGAADTAPEAIDILYSAFALHHLDDDAKKAFLQLSRSRLRAQGVFLWADVFREPGESREAYVERYVARIRRHWHPLSPEQQDHLISHLSSCDIPADRDAIRSAAEAAGWQWRWAWNGSHRAEALAVLSPA